MNSYRFSTIPYLLLYESLAAYPANNFVQFLVGRFGMETTAGLINKYNIGTSRHWRGATVFWQTDRQGRLRTGKIMKYDARSGKRIKQPYNHITWVHTVLKLPDYELKQCLFGEHLLAVCNSCHGEPRSCHGEPRRTMTAEHCAKPRPTIAIVESEKTAIIASVYLPQFTWLACGSLTNLTEEKCSVLRGYPVVLFPDLNGYTRWYEKAAELAHITSFTVSSLLEQKTTAGERRQGFDLADYLLRNEVITYMSRK